MTEARQQPQQDLAAAPEGPGGQQAGVAPSRQPQRVPTPQAGDGLYDLPLLVRPAEGPDLRFIYSSWMNSLRGCEPFCRVDKNWFFASQHALITRLLNRSMVLVACSVKNQDQLYGFIVAEPTHEERLLHWVYTKKASRGRGPGYRRAGVATRLMEAVFPLLGEVDILGTIRTPSCANLPAAWRLSYNTHRLCEGSA